MSDDQDLVRAFQAMAEGALRPTPPVDTVELETEDGVELLLHGPGPAYQDHGVLVIPAALLDER